MSCKQRQIMLFFLFCFCTTIQADDGGVEVTPSTTNISYEAASFNVTVNAASNEGWSVSCADTWITLSGFTSAYGYSYGQYFGSGSFKVGIPVHYAHEARISSISVADELISIMQGENPYTYSVSPSSFIDNGCTNSMAAVFVNTQPDAVWDITDTDSWVASDGAGLTPGPGEAILFFGLNPLCDDREHTLKIAGQDIRVFQKALPIAVYPREVDVSWEGTDWIGPMVHCGQECHWTAYPPSNSWVSIVWAGGQITPKLHTNDWGYTWVEAQGWGGFTMAVAPNTSAMPRSTSMLVANDIYTINQEGNVCPHTISTNRIEAGKYTSLTCAVEVLASNSAQCAWSALSEMEWISVSPTGSVVGDAVVIVNVDENDTCDARTGVVWIAEEEVTVTQPAKTLSLSITNWLAASSASSVQTSVSAAENCFWSSKTSEAWISLSNQCRACYGYGYSYGYGCCGDGLLDIYFDEHAGCCDRDGCIYIGDQVLTVSQWAVAHMFYPKMVTLPVEGGIARLYLEAGAACWYDVTVDVPWVGIRGGNVNGYCKGYVADFGYCYSYQGCGYIDFDIFANETVQTRKGVVYLMDDCFVIKQRSSFSMLPFYFLLLE